ncbi:MAG TPA: hypothetical protein VFW11_12910 [Cyclobacteriaceae bacterium]|nr:hypothetical protein [Cyclobacteriaceae bacterium]
MANNQKEKPSIGDHYNKKIDAHKREEQQKNQTKKSMTYIERIEYGKHKTHHQNIYYYTGDAKVHKTIAQSPIIGMSNAVVKNMQTNEVWRSEIKWVVNKELKYGVAPKYWLTAKEVKISYFQNGWQEKNSPCDKCGHEEIMIEFVC